MEYTYPKLTVTTQGLFNTPIATEEIAHSGNSIWTCIRQGGRVRMYCY